MNLMGYACLDKITTYKFNLNKKTILFDYGTKIDDIDKVDYIFISHEHFDHYNGILEQALEISDYTKIFSTKTTKLLLIELIKMNLSTLDIKNNEKKRIIKLIEGIIEVPFEEEINLDNDLKFIFYPSGHTYGSAMIYLKGEKSFLYTGDMDFHPKRFERQYYFNYNLDVDYLICDGTKFLDDEKLESNDLSNLKSNKLTFKVRPEKAVFLAHKFANTSFFKDYKIFFEKDLKWYLDIIYKEGYNPYIVDKVMLDFKEIEHKTKSIYLSSKKYEKFKRNNFISLHIAKNDLLDFISKVNAKNVLIGHYNSNNPPNDFTCIRIGVNNI